MPTVVMLRIHLGRFYTYIGTRRLGNIVTLVVRCIASVHLVGFKVSDELGK